MLGCILPWKDNGLNYVTNDGSDQLMMDKRRPSCLVIWFGTPSEKLVQILWAKDRKLVFSSSPSGKGNCGLVSGIGPQIEQGVMVSMVDDQSQLLPEQKGQRQIYLPPF